MRLPIILTIFLIFIHKAFQLNILAILPYNGKSHFTVFEVYLKELAKKGHNVTVISHFPQTDPPKNYKDISLTGSTSAKEEYRNRISKFSNYKVFQSSFYLALNGIQNCEVMLANTEVQHLIKRKQKFDVAVVEQFNSDCALGVAYKIGAPAVAITSHAVMPYHFQRFGIPDNPSYVSYHFSGGGTKPSFIQRIEKIVFKFVYNIMNYYGQWMNQRIFAKYFNDIPPLEELGREIKFLLLYQNCLVMRSSVLPANVIQVGGFHVKEAKPLTRELQQFVDEAEHGIVYISFGTLLNSATLPSDKAQAIQEAMKEFRERFIWIWENDTYLDNKSKVYISSWLPQLDILGHPKTVAFLSHAGMSSITEAIHYGVPMIVMPFFGDQPSNAAAIEEGGFGVQLQYTDLTKDNLVAVLKTVLSTEFNKKAKEISRAWHDRPMPPLDTAVFWTEFAAKHPNFTYRAAAADVPLYQYLLLDVIATFLVVLGIFGYVFKACCSCRKKQQGKKIKHKRQ